jgi:chemotaxis protein methyltransferase CheR
MTGPNAGNSTHLAGEVIARRYGISFSQDNLHTLDKALLNTARELGFQQDPNKLTDLVVKDELSAFQRETLIANLTIGETFFFRDVSTLAAVRAYILRPLIADRANQSKSLRIWSAGCCSGEEPYTIAIMLNELIPDISSWDIRILATDLNPRFLEKAAKAIYTSWSFRDTGKDMTDRYFIRRGKTFELIPAIRKLVTFKQFNLVSEPDTSMDHCIANQDIIFCRNVLMYFSAGQAARVAERFYRSLIETGWFVTSPVEVSLPLFSIFVPVLFDGLTIYQKNNRPQIPPVGPPVQLASIAPKSLTSPKKRAARLPEQPVKKSVPAEKADTVARLSDQVKAFANAGKLIHARESSEKLLKLDSGNPGFHYFHATIVAEMNLFDEAEQALQKALYIDPSHLVSHLQMARIASKTGKISKCKKYYGNVKELLASYSDDQIVPDSDGMTAGRIKEFVYSMIL